ncbi:MAG TPA: aldo/keto reductase [Rubrivivax sp.]|nr:aldo/keto reductase [Rubrivivax sp.]
MEARRIGPFTVSAVSLGCMNLSHAYGAPPPPEAAEALLQRALDLGVTMLDTAALYGFGANETLLGRAVMNRRDRFVLASKGGMAGVAGADGGIRRVIDGRPETIRRNCEDSLRRLQAEVIDLYYLHRWDKAVPIEESVGAMADLVREGKVRALGLSEVSAQTLRRAHAVHPIAAVQSEYSLWSRNVEIGVRQACLDIGAALVAFSPTARAFLTGTLRDVATLDAKDIRRGMPRFHPDNYARNLKLLGGFAELARDAGCSMAQLAIAWVLSRGDHVVALPGTTQIAHLQENLGAAGVTLGAGVLQRLDALINRETVAGARYNPATQAEIDTEEFV